jgi:hypothetical protein
MQAAHVNRVTPRGRCHGRNRAARAGLVVRPAQSMDGARSAGPASPVGRPGLMGTKELPRPHSSQPSSTEIEPKILRKAKSRLLAIEYDNGSCT